MRRRTFIGNSLAGGALLGGTLAPQSVLAKRPRKTITTNTVGKYDTLLKGGHVIDLANHINSNNMDVAVTDGKIAAVGRNIPAADAKETIDVSGLYVTPGFIDMHAHGFYTDLDAVIRWIIFDDHCFPSGVTTVLDVGSSGAGTFEDFKKLIDGSKTRTLALLNISYTGMDEGEQNPAQYKIEPLVDMAKQYPETIVGVKLAHYWTTEPYDKIHTPWVNVDAAEKAGHILGLPVMFDWYPRPASGGYPARTYRELILEKSRPGDIHTHCYARHIPVIQENGKVNPDIFKARERGFIFDVGHGAGSFVYRNALPAIQQGYLPDSISTDLHAKNTCGPVINMANVMSKFLCMGLSLEDVILRSTINPARILNRPELGSLTSGHTADIAVFELLEGNYSFLDTSGGKDFGNKKIYNIMTLSGGDIVFDPWGLSYPYWKESKDKEYWRNPSGQYF
jgi:dihydroorotase